MTALPPTLLRAGGDVRRVIHLTNIGAGNFAGARVGALDSSHRADRVGARAGNTGECHLRRANQ
jgi:hypothetical protein